MRKFWRVYYDRRDESGKVWWSVDNGTMSTEIKVSWFNCMCPLSSQCSYVHVEGEPSAWFSFEATAEFKDGGVLFHNAS